MVKKSTSSVFRGKQGYMYAVALIGWLNYMEYQADFESINSTYTKELAQQQQAAIEAARNQPNVKQRREVPKKARIRLGQAAADFRASWQLLASLIEKSFPENQWAMVKTEAGSNYYLKSAAENWPATFDMGDAASAFISENEEALRAGGMPSAFPQQFAGVKEIYDGLYSTFYTIRQDSKDNTKKKRGSNTAVYKITMSMLKDGVKIFRNTPDVREKFVYASLMKLVSGQSLTKTGYHFILKDAATGLPVSTAKAMFTAADGSSYSGKMGKNGNLHCTMPAGKYDYVLTSPGYTTLIGMVNAIEGSLRHKTLRLTADAGSNNTPQSRAV